MIYSASSCWKLLQYSIGKVIRKDKKFFRFRAYFSLSFLNRSKFMSNGYLLLALMPCTGQRNNYYEKNKIRVVETLRMS